ncbi:MAG: glycerol-3-phosphate dehydrogenase/oxidase [Cytophagaceae bacterium]
MSYFLQRKDLLVQDSNRKFGLIVIGGGITGCGIALDAQLRGIPTLLIEKRDFASGTSSRSTKLIHGGLRYLKQFEFDLVKETGRERAVVHQLAPHITVSEPMLLPIVKNGSMSKWLAAIGTWVYDYLAGVKSRERRKVLNKQKTCSREPLLDKEQVTGGIYYYEYRTDDARLTLAVAQTAKQNGAALHSYLKVENLLFKDDVVKGVVATDELSGERYEFYAESVVNATGPWVDDIDALDVSADKDKLFLTKGVHIVVPHPKLPIAQAVYFDVGDKRMVFAIPRDGKTYIGTTDTAYTGAKEEPEVTVDDKIYLIHAVKKVFPSVQLTIADIESQWAGLRPLIKDKKSKSPSAISRKDEIFISKKGLITIAGGKLTGYRKMAERVVDIVAKKLQNRYTLSVCRTESTVLFGGDIKRLGGLRWYAQKELVNFKLAGIPEKAANKMIRILGANASRYLKLYHNLPASLEAVDIPKWMTTWVYYCDQFEMICKPEDFIIRRTGDLFFNIQEANDMREGILECMSILYDWDFATMVKRRKELNSFF